MTARAAGPGPLGRLAVDPVACEAVGLCAHLAPASVTLDRWGYPVVQEPLQDARQLAAAQRAARACPRRALHVLDPDRAPVR